MNSSRPRPSSPVPTPPADNRHENHAGTDNALFQNQPDLNSPEVSQDLPFLQETPQGGHSAFVSSGSTNESRPGGMEPIDISSGNEHEPESEEESYQIQDVGRIKKGRQRG